MESIPIEPRPPEGRRWRGSPGRHALALCGLALLSHLLAPRASAQTGAPPGRWVSLGPTKIAHGQSGVANGDVTGRVTTIAVHPTNPDILFVGARGSGVWRTTKGLGAWEPVTDSLPTQTVAAVALAPSLPTRVYMVSPAGTFRSDDLGDSWSQVSTQSLSARGWDGGVLLVDPRDPNRLYLTTCTTSSSTGIVRSLDGGATWQRVLGGGCATGLSQDPSDPDRLLASFQSIPGTPLGLWESSDGGDSWNARPGCPQAPLPDMTNAEQIRLAQAGDVRFVSIKTATTFQVFRASGKTCGSGASRDYLWEPGWSADPADVWNFWSALYVNPSDDRHVFATGISLWASHDGGFHFELVDPQPHVDYHAFAADPASPQTLYFGSDGGLFKTTNSGQDGGWSFAGEGIVNAEFYDIADAATKPRLLNGGTQDNGVAEYDGGGTIWEGKWGGDAEMVEIDPVDSDTRYVAAQNIVQLTRTQNAWASGAAIAQGIPNAFCPPWNTEYPAIPRSRFSIHPTQPSILLASCGPLFIGWPFQQLFAPSVAILTNTVDPTVSLYWAGSVDGRLFAGAGGLSWVEVFQHPAFQSSSDLEIDPSNPTVLFASFLGGGAGRVYRVQRFSGAPSFVTAFDITANLPAGVTVKAIGVDRLRPDLIFVGTDSGVYRGASADGGVTWSWSSYKDGMPEAVDVRDLEVHPTTGVIRAGTFGRGAYEVQTDWPIGQLVAVEGKVSLLRVHDEGTAYGPPGDVLDAEVIVQLANQSGYAYGFQLRADSQGPARKGMLDQLRDAFRKDKAVRLEYVRTGFRNGQIQRVINLP